MDPGDLRLLIGLGNPGSKYSSTRHNIGFMALEKLAAKNAIEFKKQKNIFGDLAEIKDIDNPMKLFLPNTYMNDSGRAIRACLDWFNIGIHQIIVIVDDMDLPLGKLRLRAKGSAGGHNGLKSTIQHLKNENFCRLRVGIGAPCEGANNRKSQTVSHVLGKFTAKEKPLINEVLNEVLYGIELIQERGSDRAANHLNGFFAKDNKQDD